MEAALRSSRLGDSGLQLTDSLDAAFQHIAAANGADSSGGTGEDEITRQESADVREI